MDEYGLDCLKNVYIPRKPFYLIHIGREKLTNMLKRFFNSLESPKNPLLGPNLKGLEFTGMLTPERGIKKHLGYLVHIIAILFVISQFVELWLIRSDLDSAMRNLSISMQSTVCIIKAWTFIRWGKHWREIINAVSETEVRQMSRQDDATCSIIKEYIKYSRAVTLFYFTLATATALTLDLAPLIAYVSDAEYRQRISDKLEPYPEITSSWLPFDRSNFNSYCIYVVEHVIMNFYGASIVAAYDSMAVVMMTFFAGQLKLLKVNCDRIFGDGKMVLSDEEAIKKIRECHEHHLHLVKYSKLLNSLLSPVMFLYVIICSLMICASVIQLTKEGTTRMQQIWIAEYVGALVAQLFLYCWHGNTVLYMSKEVDRGVYSSAWWSRNARVRRSILLLGGQLRKVIVFRAGPFTTLSVTSFVTILKGSYSYFAILNK